MHTSIHMVKYGAHIYDDGQPYAVHEVHTQWQSLSHAYLATDEPRNGPKGHLVCSDIQEQADLYVYVCEDACLCVCVRVCVCACVCVSVCVCEMDSEQARVLYICVCAHMLIILFTYTVACKAARDRYEFTGALPRQECVMTRQVRMLDDSLQQGQRPQAGKAIRQAPDGEMTDCFAHHCHSRKM